MYLLINSSVTSIGYKCPSSLQCSGLSLKCFCPLACDMQTQQKYDQHLVHCTWEQPPLIRAIEAPHLAFGQRLAQCFK